MINDKQRREIIEEARKYVGTPFQHQGRNLTGGVDCIGLVVKVLDKLGYRTDDEPYYSIIPSKQTPTGNVEERLERYCDKIEGPENGAIFYMELMGGVPHVGFLCTDTNTIIHSYSVLRKVAELEFTNKWKKRIISYWRIKNERR